MQSRFVETSKAMASREKRSLDSSSSQEGQPDRKRPALASVIVEALKVDSLQKLCSSLEPILRRVVSEEVERALAKLGPAAKLNGSISPKRISGPDGRRSLQLHFRSKLSLPLFTGSKVEGEQGATIHIVLLDSNTGRIVTSGPESSVKLEVVVLEGDFNAEDDEDWSHETFESHVVKEREGKRPLLNGDLQLALKEGVGTLGELTFTDNSSWIRSRKFRLGLRVSSGGFDGVRIREAKTEAFAVRDHRGELYKKHYPPALTDEIWRLEKIGKDGSFHKRLNKAGIHTVEDFLRYVVRDPQKLRHIMGSGMSNKMWDVLVEHSKTCVLSGKMYVYYPDEPRNVGVVFNNIYVFSGLIAGGEYHSVDSLSDSQKVFVDTLVKKAYDNWAHVVEYDGKSLLGFDQNKAHPNTFDQIPSEHPFPNTDYNDNIGGQSQMQNTSLNTSYPHNHLMNPAPGSDHNMLALGQPLPNFSSGSGLSNLTSYDVPEDEIRVRSHEMLENEDMQHLLRIFNMGGGHGHTSFCANDHNNYFSPLPHSSFGFSEEEHGTRSSGRAVVGWLKLKAALRWGIFIRKKAAERRAQITELDDF